MWPSGSSRCSQNSNSIHWCPYKREEEGEEEGGEKDNLDKQGHGYRHWPKYRHRMGLARHNITKGECIQADRIRATYINFRKSILYVYDSSRMKQLTQVPCKNWITIQVTLLIQSRHNTKLTT